MKNFERPKLPSGEDATFFVTTNGCRLFLYNFQPTENYVNTVFIISGIAGINHNAERDLIEVLSNKKNRIVVIHPRGTGYSDGVRGDSLDFSDFGNDYLEVITSDKDYKSTRHKIVLFGHSMSTSILLSIAWKMDNIDGVILANPPYVLKRAKGMSPSIGQYIKYIWYMMLQPHKPIVNMAGDPSLIENSEDKIDSVSRANDPLLVKYFSMYMMIQSRKVMKAMLDNSRKSDYPLLLIYGTKDSIVDKKGCDQIVDAWKCKQKEYIIIENGTHGKSTVLLAKDTICNWLNKLETNCTVTK